MCENLSPRLREKLEIFLKDELPEKIVRDHEKKMGKEEALEKIERDLNADFMLPEAKKIRRREDG